ncbi:MAG TPA: alpha/beta fold hydrolase [Candidatus Saccharimonadales bacterium]|nr:alpha/beta fold hydrolase [Candidatus Saccharimonadales bacterium]
MNAILVPGRPDKDEHYDLKSPSNSENHWFSWLKRQLILQDIHAVSIEPPFPFRPRYDEWKKEFERFDLTPETILVGHSCGGGFLVRYLSEHKDVRVGKVALVAPWINPDNNPRSDTADFFDFDIEPDFLTRTAGVTVFVSSDDKPSVIKTVDILRSKVYGLKFKEYTNKGHFVLGSMKTEKFPELLEAVCS